MIPYVNYINPHTPHSLIVITYVIIYEWIIDVCIIRLGIVSFSYYFNNDYVYSFNLFFFSVLLVFFFCCLSKLFDW